MKTCMLIISMVSVLLISTVANAAPVAANAEKIAQVKAGQLTEARADWWGFDPVDSTTMLQAAINSGVKKLVIPKMETPWIVNPIFLASDQEVVIEGGTIIEAIRDGFKGRIDHLMSAVGKRNIILRSSGPGVILRMHKEDYRDPNKYVKAEWRHTLAFYECENVLVQGITAMSSGGDGLYISTKSRTGYCKNITIKDCVFDDHYRQGISVISVENLLIENTVMKNTEGSAPQAGIDFEPGVAGQRLVNITMKGCTFQDNASAGVIIHTYVREDSMPISFKFEDCTAINNKFTAFLGHGDADGELYISNIDVVMTNCVEEINGQKRVINDFWKDVMNIQKLPDDQQKILESLKRVDLNSIKMQPVTPSAKQVHAKLPAVRGESFMGAYAVKGQTVAFTVKIDREAKGMKVDLRSPSGAMTTLAENVPVGEERKISFVAQETGLQIIGMRLSSGWVFTKVSPESDAGLVMLALDKRIHLFRDSGDYYFHVPAGVRNFVVRVTGEGSERAQAALFDAQGKEVGSALNISTPYKFVITRKDATQGEVWMVRTAKTPGYSLEDYYIDLMGIPPIYATDKALLMTPVK